jgi:quercetin dioxygenase-like cupin family protein
MKTMNRREVCAVFSSLAAMAVLPLDASAHAEAAAEAEPLLATSQGYSFESLVANRNATGAMRPVLKGALPTGERVELHETTLLPGMMPHPPHRHRHTELMLIREGTVEFDNDGKLERLTAGGVVFAASNVMHGLKNVGATNANYFVISVGREA